jgi:REP element-mobilizing transposase RayT
MEMFLPETVAILDEIQFRLVFSCVKPAHIYFLSESLAKASISCTHENIKSTEAKRVFETISSARDSRAGMIYSGKKRVFSIKRRANASKAHEYRR